MFDLTLASIPFVGSATPIQRAISVLRRFGTNAHIYLPGVGMLNGLNAANYLDSAGTTAGTVDQPVGLVLDAAGSLGVELVTNGDFSAGATGWTLDPEWSVASGSAVHTGTASNYIRRAGTLVIGKAYLVSADVTGLIYCENSINTLIPAGVGKSAIFTATTVSLNMWSPTNGGSIDNISVREVTGIHASQSTTANKPVLRRGAVNLLTYSGDFSNAAWGTASWVVSASDTLDPFGGTTGYKITATAAPNTLIRNATATSTTQTFVVVFKPGTYTNPGFLIRNATTSTNLTSAPYTGSNVSGSDGFGSFEFKDYGSNGWKILRITCVSGMTVGDAILLYFGSTSAATNGTFFYVHSAALFQGTYTAAQIQALGGIPLTTTAPASTALGPQYWQFDGSNDSLSLGGPLFQMADDHWCGVGATCNSSGGFIALASPSYNAATASRVALLNINALTFGAWYANDASASANPGSTQVALGVPFVAGVRCVGGSAATFIDNADGAPVAIPTGATTVDSGAIAAGRGFNNFNGSQNMQIFIKGTVTQPESLLLRKLLANFQGRSI